MAVFEWLRRTGSGPGGNEERFRQAYASFRRLLGRNNELLSLLAELETDLRYEAAGAPRVRTRVRRVLDIGLELVQDFDDLTGGRAAPLFAALDRIEAQLHAQFDQVPDVEALALALPLDDPAARSPERAGGKAANLAVLSHALPGHVPPGFVVTTTAYRRLASDADITGLMRRLVADSTVGEAVLTAHAEALRQRIVSTPVPPAVAEAIASAPARTPAAGPWAVRSSGVGEDGQLSFAGQFDTILGVPTERLSEAWRQVAASRFSPRAVAYRLGGGLSEFETPMAVLVLSMVDATASGVLYTRDPHEPDADRMWISSTLGLGADLVAGTAAADLFVVSREAAGEVIESRVAHKPRALALSATPPYTTHRSVGEAAASAPSLATEDLKTLAQLGLAAERLFGQPLDLEWAQDRAGTLWLLQARPLALGSHGAAHAADPTVNVRLRGRPLAPGRAVGPIRRVLTASAFDEVPDDAVVVVAQPTPELSRVLDRVAAVVAEGGTPQSHAASLVRQAGVPAVFGAAGALALLQDGEMVGVDGTRGEICAGVPWPDRVGRTRRRGTPRERTGFIDDLVLRLHLLDPDDPEFGASGCRSVHDLVRVVHERALAAMFRLGDRHARGAGRASRQLATRIPLGLDVLDLGGAVDPSGAGRRTVTPEAIRSRPFQAIWSGIGDPRVSWAGRRTVSAAGFLSVLHGAASGEARALRQLGDRNYLIVAPDYLNLNARLAYHYAMIDSVVGALPDNNYVAFRFFGGGASVERRGLRARFLASVLERAGFAVDCRGDLVNAWIRASAGETCETGLALLGRLMACARQLDMLLDDERAVGQYVERFFAGDFSAFA